MPKFCDVVNCTLPVFSKNKCKFHQYLREDLKLKNEAKKLQAQNKIRENNKIVSRSGYKRRIYTQPKKTASRSGIKQLTAQQENEKAYFRISKQYLIKREGSLCEIRSPECQGLGSCIHHKRGRGKYLCAVEYFCFSCYACNDYVERNHKWAADRGFKLSRLKKD